MSNVHCVKPFVLQYLVQCTASAGPADSVSAAQRLGKRKRRPTAVPRAANIDPGGGPPSHTQLDCTHCGTKHV